ncbi:YheC/YheD family protein [Paenibacillus faecalis]|uniref:YheC/YheD family endospore coat-associated protein n=1 Tax=Paenibacillus faecalis TaxID=2079532 RepID=UPI000D0E5AB5|nr:YheC/YheD family protein [Paenibacillus faecalis]
MPSDNNLGTLGVMVCRRTGTPPFAEKEFLRELCLASSCLDITVFVFSPEDKQNTPERNDQIPGYTYRNGSWEKSSFPVPDIIYDRCLFKNIGETSAVATFLGNLPDKRWWWLSRGLPGKKRVYDLLKREQRLAPYLPHTLTYTGNDSLKMAISMFDGKLFLKPSGGSHGKHTLFVDCTDHKIAYLQGRNRDNSIFKTTLPTSELASRIKKFTEGRRFIIQPYLTLTSRDGRPYDVRVLVQKNAQGLWTTTGMAIRQGSAEGITSNLHGGGTALPVSVFLESEFGALTAEHIITCIKQLSDLIPPILEGGFGRLGELGIDFGIEYSGKVWLLEVNSKPGRLAFRQTGDIPAAKLSVENPLRYARYLLLRQLRRVNT